MANLISTYLSQERWKEAEDLGTELVEIRKRVLGPKHPEVLTDLSRLAVAWTFLGRAQDALALMETCVELANRVLRYDHLHFLLIRSNWEFISDFLLDKHSQVPNHAEAY